MSDARIAHGNIAVDLEPYGLGASEVLEGDPQPTGHIIFRAGDGEPKLVTGIYACQPGVVRNELTANETIHVLEGEVHLELDSGDSVDLAPGDVATLPRGSWVTWTFKTPFRELFILSA